MKSVLLGSHLQDLKDLTHDFLYETYRTERLTKVTGNGQAFDDEENEDAEFHDTVEHQLNDSNRGVGGDNNNNNNNNASTIPSMSNLAQLTTSTNEHDASHIDNNSITSTSSSIKKSTSMLIDDHPSSSPKLKNISSFTSSTSTVSLEGGEKKVVIMTEGLIVPVPVPIIIIMPLKDYQLDLNVINCVKFQRLYLMC